MNLVIAAAQSASFPGDIPRNVAHHLRFAERAEANGVEVLVFPELSLTGYELSLARANAMRPGHPSLESLREFSARARMTIVAGVPLLNENGDLHIGAVVFRPNRSSTTYTKQHTHFTEEEVFRPGHGGAPLQIQNATVALAICRDAKFPQHAANAAALGADVYAAGALVVKEEYAQKEAILESHARLHKIAVLLANYSGTSGALVSAGRSALWANDGSLVCAIDSDQEALLIGRSQNGAWSADVVPL